MNRKYRLRYLLLILLLFICVGMFFGIMDSEKPLAEDVILVNLGADVSETEPYTGGSANE